MDPRLFTPTPFVPEIRLANEARELTVLFADIRGFSRIAERLDSQALHAYVNRFLTAMTEVVLRFQGTIDKYIGDSVMAYWGAPLFDPEHEDRALNAAFAMVIAAQHWIGSLRRRVALDSRSVSASILALFRSVPWVQKRMKRRR